MQNKTNNHSLYFIAIVPDEPISSKITLLKKWMYEHYNSKGALRSPPHITLHMPFKWKPEKEPLLEKSLSQLSVISTSFELKINKYGCFEPRVIYLNVEENESLSQLKKEVMGVSRKEWKLVPPKDERGFHPHITIGFRDLKKPLFYKAWEEVKNKTMTESFEVNALVLLKHNGKNWDEFKRFSFPINSATAS